MRRAAASAALGAALTFASTAAAHVIASPSFLPAGETETIELSVPNEREATMTGFVVTAPPEIEVVAAETVEGWASAVEGQVATWTGGSLPSRLSETFGLRIRPTGEPGAVELDAEQRYADGKVDWPVALTVVPGSATSTSGSRSGSAPIVLALAGIGVLVAGGVAALAWRRRAPG